MPRFCVVVINDDPVIVRLLTHVLTEDGYHVVGAVGDREGYAAIAHERPQVVVFDRTGTSFDTDWYVLALSWEQEAEIQHRTILPPPFDLTRLRTTLAHMIAIQAMPPVMERARGRSEPDTP